MNIKIESNGKGSGTKITNSNTGDIIEGVQDVKLYSKNGVWFADVTFIMPEIGLHARLESDN